MEFGFTLGVMVAFWVGALLWDNTKETKQALSILSAIQIAILIADKMLNG